MISLTGIGIPPTEIPSEFRLFCMSKWFEHKDEIFLWTGSDVKYDDKYYFRKHRWLLKSMFKENKNGTN